MAKVREELEYKPFFFGGLLGGLMVTGILNNESYIRVPSMHDGKVVRALVVEEEEHWNNVTVLSIAASCELSYGTLEIIVNKGIFLIYYGNKDQFDSIFPIPVSQEFAEIGLGYTEEEVQNLRQNLKYTII